MTIKKYGKVILSVLIFVIFTAITGYSMGITFGKNSGKETAMATINERIEKALGNSQQQIDELSKTNRKLLEENNKKNEKNDSDKNNDKKKTDSSVKKKSDRKKTASSGRNIRNQRKPSSSDGDVSIPNKLKDGIYQGKGQGYAGEIMVKVTVSNGKISDIKVVSHSETPGYYENGAKVIDKILSSQSTNVDTISGATYTSGAIKTAVANALKNAGDTNSSSNGNLENLISENEKYKKEIDELKKKLKKINKENEKNQNSAKFKDGIYKGEGRGYKSIIKVSVKISNNKISKIDILNHSEDEAFFNRAKNIIKDIVLTGNTKVDSISNATRSSEGIKSAVDDALSKAKISNDNSVNNSVIKKLKENIDLLDREKKELNSKIKELNKIITEKNNEISKLNSNKPLKDGVYQGKGRGFQNRITTVQVKINDGKIKEIEILFSGDDQEYLDMNKVLIENIISKNSIDVDTISGATFSSRGIKEAVSEVLNKAATSNNGNSIINDLQNKIKELKKIITDKDDEIKSKDQIIKNKDKEIEQLKKKLNDNNIHDNDLPNENNKSFNIPKDKNGTFIGSSKGHNGGEILVEVEVKNGMIDEIKVLKHNDDVPYFQIAKRIKMKIKEKNYSDIFEAYNKYKKLSDMIINKDKNLPKFIDDKIMNLEIPDVSDRNQFNEYFTEISKIIKSYLALEDRKSFEVINTTSGATRSTIGILEAVKNSLK